MGLRAWLSLSNDTFKSRHAHLSALPRFRSANIPSFRGIATGSRACAPDGRFRDEPGISRHNLWISGSR
jgi:hypothetical protein